MATQTSLRKYLKRPAMDSKKDEKKVQSSIAKFFKPEKRNDSTDMDVVCLGGKIATSKPTRLAKKKPVGRPFKPITLQEVNQKMEKCHDFWNMVDHYQRYETIVENFYLLPSDDLSSPTKSRKRFSGNYHETARAFDLNESTVRGIVNTKPLQGRGTKAKKTNHPGAGRKTSYPPEVEEELVKWVLVLRSKFPCIYLGFEGKSKETDSTS